MYESIGLYGESAVRKLDLDGKVLLEHKMDQQYFAEGLDVVNGKLVQLTWMEKVVFFYDLETLEQLQMLPQPLTVTGQGWGVTNNGTHLIVSDGSSFLYFWDPETLKEVGRVQVRNETFAREFRPLYKRLGHMLNLKPDGDKVHFLNELEYVNGEVLANVWYSDKILRISPTTGEVLGSHDFTNYHDAARTGQEDCLNGIAYHAQNKQLYITGKKFNTMWELDYV
jgi:glutamine cyclotransferase